MPNSPRARYIYPLLFICTSTCGPAHIAPCTPPPAPPCPLYPLNTRPYASLTTTSKQRYAAGNAYIVPSEAPPRRGRGRGNASPRLLPSVAESGDLSASSDESEEGDTRARGGQPVADGGYASGFGQGGEGLDDTGALAAGGDVTAHEAWKREAMECGIEFVVSGEKYYEGFKRSEVEEEEELQRRGGIGYRPFGDAEFDKAAVADMGYDAMEEAVVESNGDGRGDSSDKARDASEDVGKKEDSATRRGEGEDRLRRAAHEATVGNGTVRGKELPEEKREFERVGLLRRDTTGRNPAEERGEQDGVPAEQVPAVQMPAVQVPAVQVPAEQGRMAGCIWQSASEDSNDFDEDDDSDYEQGGGDDAYGGFETESTTSSMHSSGITTAARCLALVIC